MKKVIKKKKAFTLVELMGVLVILGVLTTILVPVISNALKESKEKAYQSQLQNIVLAAKNFGSDNMYLLPETEGESINITLGQLKKSGYLEDSVVNPKTKKEISNCMRLEIKNINNNHEYNLDENTIEVENCNENFNSDIIISDPSKEYIKEGSTASYILIMKPSDETQVLSYNLDDSKILLGENTSSKYLVVGENGIYKIVIMAGEIEEDITLTFDEGAITDNAGNNIDTSNVAITSIKVDNTAPTIEFVNNGSDWTNNASTKINVNDEKSGGDSSTYKYIYSSVTSAEPTNSFSTDEAVSYTSGNGEYYLIASACDRAGNCSKETSNYFKMDTTAPSVPNVNLVYEDGTSYNQTWTNKNIILKHSSSDDGAGEVYYEFKHSNSACNSGIESKHNDYCVMPIDWKISWDVNLDFKVRACDGLGNCSADASAYYIKIDKTPPTITSINNGSGGSWTNGNVTISASGSDSGSGMEGIYYRYSSTDSLKNDWATGSNATSVTGIWGAERNQEVFFLAKDKAGNYSSDTSGGYIRIDKTAPVIATPTMTRSVSTSAGVHRQLNVSITENDSGVRGEDTTVRYEHSTLLGVGTAPLAWVNGTSRPYQFNQWFGYDSVSTNILYVVISSKDYAGNSTSKYCECNYGSNTCTCP